MLNFTPIARMLLLPRARKAIRAAANPEPTQLAVLRSLLAQGAKTQWGREHGLRPDMSYAEYASAVPIQGYEEFRPYAMRMVQGERDVLWPGATMRYAQSSGTSGGKSKYIPITETSLKLNHYPGASLAVALYLLRNPESRMFAGKGLILGGSFANELEIPTAAKVGDLSASLIDAIGSAAEIFRVPGKEVALMADWSRKLPDIATAAATANVTNISGVPSWMLTVLKEMLAITGKEKVQDVWPNIEVFLHGGIAFEPYRAEYDKIMPAGMKYWNTYNASEGFFAAQSEPDDPSMMLLANIGVFYEFVPLAQAHDPNPQAIPLWQVEAGRTYSLIISACNGLWRYAIGDTVLVVSTNPVKIAIAGRTTSYINAFGEEVMVYNTDAAIAAACRELGCSIANYTVAPIYAHDQQKGCHQWAIEWQTPPSDIARFAEILDQKLQGENSDYQAKRQGSLFLDLPQVESVPAGTFDRWLSRNGGKLGGQRKIPRLSNDRSIMDQILNLQTSRTIEK